MEKLDKINIEKLIPYLIISVIATAIDLGSYLYLLNILSWHYILANIISIILGILTKFSLNKAITFKDRNEKTWQQQFRRFITVSGSGFILSNFVLAFLVEVIEISEEISKIIAIGVVFFYTFVLHNFYSFK
ncbi:MAG: GtrA family protein [Candidatus Kariarchaeaceae archaeon]|jgi:putative flippase GtrA